MGSGICEVKFENGLLDIEMPTIVSLLDVLSRHTVIVFKSPWLYDWKIKLIWISDTQYLDG